MILNKTVETVTSGSNDIWTAIRRYSEQNPNIEVNISEAWDHKEKWLPQKITIFSQLLCTQYALGKFHYYHEGFEEIRLLKGWYGTQFSHIQLIFHKLLEYYL